MSIDFKFHIEKINFKSCIELSLCSKSITVLFGSSGSGKTSLLRAIAGLDFWQQSEIILDNIVWQNQKINVSARERGIGYVFQNHQLFSHLNVLDNCLFGWKRQDNKTLNLKQKKSYFEDIIDLCDIRHLLQRNVNSLSGGETQKVALAQMLANKPKLILMDEPLNAIDESSKYQLLQEIKAIQIHTQIPIIYVSHDLREAATLGDEMVLLEKGRVLCQGSVNKVMQSPLVIQQKQALNVLTAQALRVEENHCLIQLADQQCIVSKRVVQQSSCRLLISKSSMIISLEKPENSSAACVLECEIIATQPFTLKTMVKLVVKRSTPEQFLVAEINTSKIKTMKLKQGLTVFSQLTHL